MVRIEPGGQAPAALPEEGRACHEICAAVTRYARGRDRCDREDVLAAFHPGAFLDYQGFAGTPQEFCDWLMPRRLAGLGWTICRTGAPFVEVDAGRGRALAETSVRAKLRFTKEGKPFDRHASARYVDVFETQGGVWRIALRRTVIDSERTVPVPARDSANPDFADAPGSSPGRRLARPDALTVTRRQ